MGGQTSTTKTENSPPKWAKPLFKQSAQEAQNLYNSGSGGHTYTGSTVAPLSDTTVSGLNQLVSAGQNYDTSGTRPIFQQLGAGAVSNPNIPALQGVAGGVGDIASGNTGITNADQYQSVFDRAGQPTAASQYLTGMASGDNLLANPYFEDALQGQLDKTADRVQSLFSGAGRYGSGANTEALANELGNIRSNALFNQYNQDVANQLAATGMIDSANNAAAGTQLNAASGLSGVQNQNIGNRLAGAGLQGNLLSNAGNLYQSGIGQGLDAAGAMAGLDQQNFENRLAGAGATLQAGGALDTQAQKQLSDFVNAWTQADNEDWNRLGLLQSAAAGSAGQYGTQTSRTSQPFNPLPAIGSFFGAKGGA